MSSSSGADLEKYFIPLDEINRATDNFSRERYIGGGGFGGVYKGQLSEHWLNQTVAVKRLDADSHQGNREFRNELEIISRFHHENIITFVGYCDEGVEMIIVYEYASNGSLDHHLQDPNKMSCITWAQRLEICIGAARGLHYLHSGLGEKHRVIHRDVKSANILLDDNMVAKICDFGLSKLGARNQPDTQRYTKVAGTQFYLDPSYLESGILQKESDVYSFGVVLFEILSGMLVYSERRIGGERQPLMNSVRRFHENEPDKVVDPRIRDQIKSLSFETFKLTAYECINFKKTDRPTLDTVIKKLEDALNFQMYEHPASTPACGTLIESIIGNLNSVTPYDHRIASNEICLRTKHCDENRVAFGQAGAIPRLTHLLTTPDSRTREHALMALNYLSLHKGNHGIIVSSLDVLEIIHTLEKGSKEAREHAAAIYNLYVVRPGSTITSQGAIPPLMLMLGEGTTTGKMNAAVSLLDLCKTSVNRERVLRAGVVPVLMELLKEPQVELKEMYLSIIRELFRHPEGKLAIGEAEAVRHLLEFIGSGTDICDNYAVAVLDELCSMDEKYLVEAQEYGAMEKLKYVRTAYAKWTANDIQNKIKYHEQGALKYFFDKITNIHL